MHFFTRAPGTAALRRLIGTETPRGRFSRGGLRHGASGSDRRRRRVGGWRQGSWLSAVAMSARCVELLLKPFPQQFGGGVNGLGLVVPFEVIEGVMESGEHSFRRASAEILPHGNIHGGPREF